MADDTVSVTNNENPAINLEITTYSNSANIEFVESIDSALSVHNTNSIAHANLVNPILQDITSINSDITTLDNNKVDKVTGKALSTNDLTNTLKSNYDTSFTNTHTHSNKTLLDNLISSGNGSSFLSNDGGYKELNLFSSSVSNMPTMANNSSDANNDIDFSAGFCYDTSTNAKITSTAITKRLDAAWAAGNNQGGLDTGSKASSTCYNCFAISKAGGTSDFLFSTSSTSPTMPTDYVNKRRIGAIKTDGSGNIVQFIQDSDRFYYVTPIFDVSTSTLGATSTNYILSVPPSTICIINACALNASTSTYVYLRNPNTTDLAPAGNANPLVTMVIGTNAYAAASNAQIKTNSSSQISARALTESTQLYISTLGYIDKRGVK